MEERRKQPRKDLMSYSQVYDLRDGKLIGYLGDLNLLGGMVISSQRMEKDSELTISIELPELAGITETTIILPVRVAWCREDVSPDYFNIGMEFKVVNERQKAIINAIMEKYEFKRQIPHYPPRPSEQSLDE
ncbi:MAG TPA: PilZ domain-containing protein [Anaerolineales bacterium]|nr:PilZ domain-containing protein [Anaerolineales bacterium]